MADQAYTKSFMSHTQSSVSGAHTQAAFGSMVQHPFLYNYNGWSHEGCMVVQVYCCILPQCGQKINSLLVMKGVCIDHKGGGLECWGSVSMS